MIDQDRAAQDNDEPEDLSSSDVQHIQDDAGIAGEPQPESGNEGEQEEPAAHPS